MTMNAKALSINRQSTLKEKSTIARGWKGKIRSINNNAQLNNELINNNAV